MKIYLVGGAVRDAQLGQTVRERDWVVVGSTPEAMEALGFKRVGRSFPVFLHPETHEEYALARLETPTGPKHTDFKLRFSPETTLEEDLQRRDLTINAMAQSDEGLIDPYGGLKDLKQGVFRHVSNAFIEDPLRVLRVARFAASPWGQRFEVAPETEALLTAMVKADMLTQLSKERIWGELFKALTSPNPDRSLQLLHRWGAWAQWGLPFPLHAEQLFEAFVGALQLPCAQSAQLRYALWLETLGDALEQEGKHFSAVAWHETLGAPPLFRSFADWSQQQRFAVQSGFWKLQTRHLDAVPWFELLGKREERSSEVLELKMDWLVTKRWRDNAEFMESERDLWPRFKSTWVRRFKAAWALKLSPEALKVLRGAERAQALQAKRRHFLQHFKQGTGEKPEWDR